MRKLSNPVKKNDKGRIVINNWLCATNILDRVPGGLDFLEVHDEIKIDLHRTTSSRFVSVDAFHVQGGLFGIS